MHRFFIEPAAITGEQVILPGEAAYQIRKVLRLQTGESILALDNSGWEYTVELTAITPKGVTGRITSKSQTPGEPEMQVTLYQSLLKKDNFEWVLQKCTEIGVCRFAPFVSERTIPHAEISPSKRQRWERVIREAAEQSRRGRLPVLDEPLTFAEATKHSQGNDLRVIPWEKEERQTLQPLLAQPCATMAIFIGPEGGFADAEIDFARQQGLIPVTLGKRTLRAETAAIFVTAVVFHAML